MNSDKVRKYAMQSQQRTVLAPKVRLLSRSIYYSRSYDELFIRADNNITYYAFILFTKTKLITYYIIVSTFSRKIVNWKIIHHCNVFNLSYYNCVGMFICQIEKEQSSSGIVRVYFKI